MLGMEPAPRPKVPYRTDEDRTIDAERVGDLLAALEDEDCRVLLQAADGDAMSVSELSEICDLPLSTTYRKVDKLTEAGLFEERLRLCSSGKHTSEYALRIEELTVSLGGDGIEMQISSRGDTDESDVPHSVIVGAD